LKVGVADRRGSTLQPILTLSAIDWPTPFFFFLYS